MAALTYLDKGQLVDLADRGQVSHVLQQNWLKRTGCDPVQLARGNLGYQKWCKRGYATCFILVVFCLLALFVANLATKKGVKFLPESMELLSLAMLIGAIVVLGIVWPSWSWKAGSGRTDPILGSASYFSLCQTSFMEWTNTTNEQVKAMSKEELNAAAEQALVNKAKEVLQFQAQNKDVPHEHWVGSKRKLTDEFDWRYRVLSDLGIAGGPFAKFYDKARKQLGGQS